MAEAVRAGGAFGVALGDAEGDASGAALSAGGDWDAAARSPAPGGAGQPGSDAAQGAIAAARTDHLHIRATGPGPILHDYRHCAVRSIEAQGLAPSDPGVRARTAMHWIDTRGPLEIHELLTSRPLRADSAGARMAEYHVARAQVAIVMRDFETADELLARARECNPQV